MISVVKYCRLPYASCLLHFFHRRHRTFIRSVDSYRSNNIINSVFYWYWHSKLTIIHEMLPAIISIWHIQKNGGLFSAQTDSREHLCLHGVPKTGTVYKNII